MLFCSIFKKKGSYHLGDLLMFLLGFVFPSVHCLIANESGVYLA